MEIDELPSGTQDQKPDIDMNEIVGTHDILMLCFDTLRYDVSVAEEASGGTPVLNSCGNGWEKRHAPGNFTYPSHFAIFVTESGSFSPFRPVRDVYLPKAVMLSKRLRSYRVWLR